MNHQSHNNASPSIPNHIGSALNRLLRIKQIAATFAISKSNVYAAIERGEFTKPIKINGSRASAWLESEVCEILNARIRGESSASVKELVKTLEAKRLSAGVFPECKKVNPAEKTATHSQQRSEVQS